MTFVAGLEVDGSGRVRFVGLGQYAEMVFGMRGTSGGACAVEAELGFHAGFGCTFDEAEDFAAMLFFGCERIGVLGGVVRVGMNRGVDLFVRGVEGKFVGIELFWMVGWWLVRGRRRGKRSFVGFTYSQEGDGELLKKG